MLVFKHKSAGFTLIELMIAIVILGILVSAAYPSFRGMLMNSQVRNAAESVVNGMQKARANAVSRNTNMEFILAAGTSTSWTVKCANTAATACADLTAGVIEIRSGIEGSANVVAARTPAAATTVTFSNLGLVVANADGSVKLTDVGFSANGANRNLAVKLYAGGTPRMCDPAFATGDSRAC